MAFAHLGESADQYVLDLWREQKHDESNYADAYLKYLRKGGPAPQIGTRGRVVTPGEASRIRTRLMNTGTSADFAKRAIGGTYGTFRKRAGSRRSKHFTADEWVGKPGREWREGHRCSYPHNSSEANSRTNCPEWRHVAPSPAAIDRELHRLHNRGQTRSKILGRTGDRAARRAGKR